MCNQSYMISLHVCIHSFLRDKVRHVVKKQCGGKPWDMRQIAGLISQDSENLSAPALETIRLGICRLPLPSLGRTSSAQALNVRAVRAHAFAAWNDHGCEWARAYLLDPVFVRLCVIWPVTLCISKVSWTNSCSVADSWRKNADCPQGKPISQLICCPSSWPSRWIWQDMLWNVVVCVRLFEQVSKYPCYSIPAWEMRSDFR